MKIKINTYLFLALALPLGSMYRERNSMSFEDYAIGALVFSIQILSIAIFYIYRNKWGEWISLRASQLNHTTDYNPIDLTVDVFYLLNTLIFSILIPYSLYLKNPIEAVHFILIFNLAFITWCMIFASPLHLIITNIHEPQRNLLKTPYLSLLAIFIIVLFDPHHLVTTLPTLIILFLFCLDIIVALGVMVYLNNKSNKKRQP